MAADLLLDDGFTAHGPVNLTDARIGGSLRLSAGRLQGRGGQALVADRIVVGGSCYARRLRSAGELRLPAGRITGNLDLAGAQLSSPTGDVLVATGVAVGGSLLAGRHGADAVCPAEGQDRAADAVCPAEGQDRAADAVCPGEGQDRAADAVCPGEGQDRAAGSDVAFEAGGRVLLAGARIGGDLAFSGARIASRTTGGPPEADREETRLPVVAGGIVDPRRARWPTVSTSTAISSSAPVCTPVLADRLRIGGEFHLRNMRCAGTIRLQNAEVGATLDCTGSVLDHPRLRPDGTVRPSLDVRACTIGKDLLCDA